jgi:RNase P subunit RPR2
VTTHTVLQPKPDDQVVEKCRQCGGLILYSPRWQDQPPSVRCEGGHGDQSALMRRLHPWLEAALDADDALQIAQCDPTVAAQMAMHIRQSMLLNRHLDAADTTILKGETYTAEDYQRMEQAAARYEARALALQTSRACERCGDPLVTSTERRTGFCHPCLWGQQADRDITDLIETLEARS